MYLVVDSFYSCDDSFNSVVDSLYSVVDSFYSLGESLYSVVDSFYSVLTVSTHVVRDVYPAAIHIFSRFFGIAVFGLVFPYIR